MTDQPLFSNAQQPAADSVRDLINMVDVLLSPGGCPWDQEQTHASLSKYLIEECYEAVDAIEHGTSSDLKEELGDVLYQVLFHARIATDFDIDEVARVTREKMESRHPHVFGDAHAETAADVVAVWDAAKAKEKASRTSALDGIPQGMPALALANKVIERSEKMGILDANADSAIQLDSEADLGRLLLALTAAAHSKGFDAERALRTTVYSFESELRSAEHGIADAGVVVAPAQNSEDPKSPKSDH